MKSKDFREELVKHKGSFLNKRYSITDELDISIQANEFAYCRPRENLQSYTDYYEFELGFPNFDPPTYIMKYVEDPEYPQDTVYGYVPFELIQKMIDDLRSEHVKKENTK